MTIRPMEDDEVAIVERLCAEIADGRVLADRPPGWHRRHPTLVAEVEGRVVGYTSYALEPGAMVWTETCVTAAYRGRGIGRALMEARLRVAQALPVQIITGAVHEDNAGMVHLLETLGLHPCQRMPSGYGMDGMMVYARHVQMENT